MKAQVRPVPDSVRTVRTGRPRHLPMTCPVSPPPIGGDRTVSAPWSRYLPWSLIGAATSATTATPGILPVEDPPSLYADEWAS